MHKDFQPHIQGLRALAVLAVVAYHAFPALVPGGFIGVDVFFVISGYLISGILYRSLAAGSFSLAGFYVRRIRRIFPALIVVMLACLGFAYVALLPEELTQLGQHVAGGAGFVSNFVLWREAGYFDNSAASKPLLHLWSLGVEEQFYIVWPLLLWLAWKVRRSVVPLTAALALASFAYSVVQVQDNPLAAFYSPLSRFWELAAGSLLAYHHYCRSEAGTAARTMQAPAWTLAGAAALLLGFGLLSSARPYPGAWAAIPVAATLLLLAGGPRAPVNRSLLSNPLMIWIGGISYPLYLWHWPLFSFAHILQSGHSEASTRMLALAASVLLAWLTARGLEDRVRAAPRAGLIAAAFAACMAVTAGAAYWTVLQAGFPQRQLANLGKYLPQAAAAAPAQAESTPAPIQIGGDPEATALAMERLRAQRKADPQFINKIWAGKDRLERYRTCHIYDTPESTMTFEGYLAVSASCTERAAGRKNVLVFGDSAAAEIYLALARAYPDIHFVQVTGSACKPFHAAYRDGAHRCLQLLDYALGLMDQRAFDGVVIASSWKDDFALALPDLQRIRERGQPVLLVGPPLMFTEEVLKTMLRLEKDEPLAAALGAMVEADSLQYAGAMAGFANANGFAYVDRLRLYCDGGCPLISAAGEPMILDKFHLSLPGVDELGRRLKAHRVLEAILP